MNEEYYDCDHEWSAYYCEYEEHTVVMEACNKCFSVNPDGLFIELKEIIREEILKESGLQVEVTLETDSEKIDRIDQCVMEILCRMPKIDDEGEEDNET